MLLSVTGFFIGVCFALIQFQNPHASSADIVQHGKQSSEDLLQTIRRLESQVSTLEKNLASERKTRRAKDETGANGAKESTVATATPVIARADRHTTWRPSAKLDKNDFTISPTLFAIYTQNTSISNASNLGWNSAFSKLFFVFERTTHM